MRAGKGGQRGTLTAETRRKARAQKKEMLAAKREDAQKVQHTPSLRTLLGDAPLLAPARPCPSCALCGSGLLLQAALCRACRRRIHRGACMHGRAARESAL
jgi:hypothetical protein